MTDSPFQEMHSLYRLFSSGQKGAVSHLKVPPEMMGSSPPPPRDEVPGIQILFPTFLDLS